MTASFTVPGAVNDIALFTVSEALAWLEGSVVTVAAGVDALPTSAAATVRVDAPEPATDAEEQS